ncbi:hypothetical protein CKA32_005082 [Geitlerinema sp. FC II]|nr:hypothetical protein CKA32_005082 [Geitlerinema sp. FC II]
MKFRLDDSYPTGEFNVVANNFDVLGVLNGLTILFALEARIFRSLIKEILEGGCQVECRRL